MVLSYIISIRVNYWFLLYIHNINELMIISMANKNGNIMYNTIIETSNTFLSI